MRSILQEMELIKGENKVITKYSLDDQEKYKTKKEELNNRLRVSNFSWQICFDLILSISLYTNKHIPCAGGDIFQIVLGWNPMAIKKIKITLNSAYV